MNGYKYQLAHLDVSEGLPTMNSSSPVLTGLLVYCGIPPSCLKVGREELCLKFAKSCLRIKKFRKFFPLKKKEHCMTMRESEKIALHKYGSVRYT